MFLDGKNQYCENDYTTQSNLQVQCNPYQTTNGIFHSARAKHFTICIEIQKTLNSHPPWGEADDLQVRQKVGIHRFTQGQVTSWVMGFWRQQTSMDSRRRKRPHRKPRACSAGWETGEEMALVTVLEADWCESSSGS